MGSGINSKKLNILHISSPGFKGSGRLVLEMHSAALRSGFNSYIITKDEAEISKHVFSFRDNVKTATKFRNILSRKFKKILNTEEISDVKYSFIDIKEKETFHASDIIKNMKFKPDIILLYALQSFVCSKTVYELHEETKAKIFWLQYDMFPFTGGCHYAWDCDGYSENCENCPAIISKKFKDQPSQNLKIKKKYYEKTDITMLACSEWLYQRSLKSSVLKNTQIIKWMFPIDNSLYNPADKNKLRIKYGLETDKKYIMLGAENLQKERKGMDYLIEALNKVEKKLENSNKIELIIAGRFGKELSSKIKLRSHVMGFIKDQVTFIELYQLSDFVIIPSLQDAGPLMINEAVTCGTPVISFNVGSALDLVIDGHSGFIAEYKNTDEMADKILHAINMDMESYKEMSENCRKIALDKIDPLSQFRRLMELKK